MCCISTERSSLENPESKVVSNSVTLFTPAQMLLVSERFEINACYAFSIVIILTSTILYFASLVSLPLKGVSLKCVALIKESVLF